MGILYFWNQETKHQEAKKTRNLFISKSENPQHLSTSVHFNQGTFTHDTFLRHRKIKHIQVSDVWKYRILDRVELCLSKYDTLLGISMRPLFVKIIMHGIFDRAGARKRAQSYLKLVCAFPDFLDFLLY